MLFLKKIDVPRGDFGCIFSASPHKPTSIVETHFLFNQNVQVLSKCADYWTRCIRSAARRSEE